MEKLLKVLQDKLIVVNGEACFKELTKDEYSTLSSVADIPVIDYSKLNYYLEIIYIDDSYMIYDKMRSQVVATFAKYDTTIDFWSLEAGKYDKTRSHEWHIPACRDFTKLTEHINDIALHLRNGDWYCCDCNEWHSKDTEYFTSGFTGRTCKKELAERIDTSGD